MESTPRIDSNVLTRQVRGAKPMGKKWIKDAIRGGKASTAASKTLKKLRKKKGK